MCKKQAHCSAASCKTQTSSVVGDNTNNGGEMDLKNYPVINPQTIPSNI
jgi:hypothetical protein